MFQMHFEMVADESKWKLFVKVFIIKKNYYVI